MYTFEVPIYYTNEYKTKKDKTILVGLNWYRNAHHRTSNIVKHYYHDIVAVLLRGKKFGKCRIHYKVFWKRRGTDPHNVRSIVEKFTLDGMVNCGALIDDSADFILGTTTDWEQDKENPRMEITIEEIQE